MESQGCLLLGNNLHFWCFSISICKNPVVYVVLPIKMHWCQSRPAGSSVSCLKVGGEDLYKVVPPRHSVHVGANNSNFTMFFCWWYIELVNWIIWVIINSNFTMVYVGDISLMGL